MQIERILCPVDFSDTSANAYRYAQSIACRYHAKLILQHVIELWPDSYHLADFRRTLRSNAEDQSRLFLQKYGGVQPECVVEESTPADAILSLAQARAVSLIVMGTHGRRGFDHLMLGSVTERVLRHAPCLVLAVPGKRPDQCGTSPAGDAVDLGRILCCVDFSSHSQRALDHAVSVVKVYGADLTILHVMEHIPESANVAEETDAVVAKLQQMVAPSLIGPTRVHLEVRLGAPYREILDFAAMNQSDLIVMGMRGRHLLDLPVFGSTTYRVIQLQTVPVLTVAI